MTTPIVVVGHRNPDNDSISAAVGYAYLKNELARRAADGAEPAETYVAARLGGLPPESEKILAENGIEAPVLLDHVHPRVADVMSTELVTVDSTATLAEAGRLLAKHDVRSLVVTNDDGTYRGLVSVRTIAGRYIASTDVSDDAAAVADDLVASLAQPVSELVEPEVLALGKEDLLQDAAAELMESSLRVGVVLDGDGVCVGIVTRSDVAVAPKRKVVLVDHNEVRQAVEGIEDAEVVEIVDHHRIADVMTANPIKFLNLPLGSTATIVSLEFERSGVELPKSIAKVLLSAILTDTVILKSPTTTDVDRTQAAKLAEAIGVDVVEFGLSVFRCRSNEADLAIDVIVESDSKEFQVGDATVLIAQRETVDLPTVLGREDEIVAHMADLVSRNGYEFALLMVTDILAEGSQFLCVGDTRRVNRAFGIECPEKGGVWMPGVLSRKKQVAAPILSA